MSVALNSLYTPSRNKLFDLTRRSRDVISTDDFNLYVQALARQSNDLDKNLARLYYYLSNITPTDVAGNNIYDFNGEGTDEIPNFRPIGSAVLNDLQISEDHTFSSLKISQLLQVISENQIDLNPLYNIPLGIPRLDNEGKLSVNHFPSFDAGTW